MADEKVREIVEAFEQLDKLLPADVARAAAVDPCKIYGQIRPFLLVLVAFLDKVLKKVADVIRFLMQIADTFCKIPPTTK